MDDLTLIKAAREALKYARAQYSQFKVGAALSTSDGEIFTGCNIECSSYGLTICSERVALVKALSAGYDDFNALAVVTESRQITFPCGACRQMLWDYAPKLQIICANLKGEYEKRALSELMPHPFGPEYLIRREK